MSPSAAPGGEKPRGLFYGWVLVAALGVTETVSYGILCYAFPVFIAPMGGELGWSKAEVTAGFSLATLVAGLVAVPVGRIVDRHGARAVMTAGSLLAAGTLLAWSRVGSLPGYYALSLALGLAMAAVLYEPAFAVVASWFAAHRGRALTLLTFLGGFASVIFVPLTTWLVQAHGWRDALVWLAALLALLTVPPHALLLRRRPEEMGLFPDGSPAPPAAGSAGAGEGMAARAAVRSPAFWWLALAFGLGALATTGVAVHLIPLLLERGHGPGFAAAALGALGLMALPGRLVFTPLGERWPRGRVTAALFVLQALGAVALLASRSTWAVWLFVALFGAGFGAITPARAALLADLFGRASYASIAGALALVVSLARAAAPLGASLVHAVGGGYAPVLWLLAAASLLSGLAVLAGTSAPAPSPRFAQVPA